MFNEFLEYIKANRRVKDNDTHTEYHKTSKIVIRVVYKRKSKAWWDIFGLTTYKEYDLHCSGKDKKGFTEEQMESILRAISDAY